MKVGIIAVGMTEFKNRWLNATYWALAQMAFADALRQAGLTPNDVDAAVYGIYNDMFQGAAIPESFLTGIIGMHGKEGIRVSNGGATGVYAMGAAYDMIASGRQHIVACVGVEKALDCFAENTGNPTPEVVRAIGQSWDVFQRSLGATASSSYAGIIQAYMDQYPEDLSMNARALFIEQVCRQGLNNPVAQRRGEVVTADMVKASRYVVYPNHLLETCVYSEGAVVILFAEWSVCCAICKNMGIKPIMVRGLGFANESTWIGRGPGHKTMHRIESDHLAAMKAYDMAGVQTSDITVVAQHCAFGPQGLITLAEMGFTPLGHAQDLVLNGDIMGDNPRLVVDPYGGLIYAGHAVGASNQMSCGEAVKALREMPNRNLAAVHGTGGQDAIYGGVFVLEGVERSNS